MICVCLNFQTDGTNSLVTNFSRPGPSAGDAVSINSATTDTTVIRLQQHRQQRQNVAPRSGAVTSGSLHATTSRASASASINLVPPSRRSSTSSSSTLPRYNKRQTKTGRQSQPAPLTIVSLAPIISERALIDGALPSPEVLRATADSESSDGQAQ